MKLSRLLLSAVLASGGYAFFAPAADPAPKKPAEGTDYTEYYYSLVASAGELTNYGREIVKGKIQSPESLVVAGGMLMRVHKATAGKSSELEAPTDATGKPIAAKAEKTVSYEDQAKGLFAEAEAAVAALDDKSRAAALQAMIVRESAPDVRGSLTGGKRITRVLNPGETHNYNITFISGQPAAVAMTSSGPPKIQFDLVHIGGNSLLSIKGHNANYSWTPQRDKDNVKHFKITLNNVGNKPTTYTLVTN